MYERGRSIGFIVNQAARLMHKAMRQQLDIADMQPAFLPVLLWLRESDGLTQKQLSERAGVEQPSMAEMLQRMEKAGLIERRADPQDGRSRTIHLSARAREHAPQVEAWLVRNNASVLEGLPAEDVAACFRVLSEIVDRLERQTSDAGDRSVRARSTPRRKDG